MNERLKIISLVSKVEQAEANTADGKYSISGAIESDSEAVTNFRGGDVMRNDGVQVARIDPCSPHSNLVVNYNTGCDFAEVSAAVVELVDALIGSRSGDAGKGVEA